MKDYCIEVASKQEGFSAKLNAMREYLQAYILMLMHKEGFFRTTAFIGGTALRLLHNLPRFSEDLDFSLAGDRKAYSFEKLIKGLKNELALAGYTVSIAYKDEKMVHSAFIKFSGLMHEAGISPLKPQNFSIKVDVDTNPPEGAVLKTDIVNKYFPISLLSYDTASLFAGKTHALLSRKYTKGRDFFDLGWYLSKWRDLTPNFHLLKNALEQTGWKGDIPSENNWKDFIYKVVQDTDWVKVKKDVENFLEKPSDIEIFTKENILGLINYEP